MNGVWMATGAAVLSFIGVMVNVFFTVRGNRSTAREIANLQNRHAEQLEETKQLLEEKRYRRQWKRDVLARLVGNRHFLTDNWMGRSSGEPFIALNQAFVAFDDSRPVLDALESVPKYVFVLHSLTNPLTRICTPVEEKPSLTVAMVVLKSFADSPCGSAMPASHNSPKSLNLFRNRLLE